jgi:hypothetical protein
LSTRRLLLPASVILLFAAPVPADMTLVVDARSNIFGAGHATAPDPGGSAGVGPGGGLLPPSVSFSAGSNSVLEFRSVTGTVSIDSRSKPFHGPDGDTTYTLTNVSSSGGISGIRDSKTLFLVGVFLGDAEPADPAPSVLDFTGGENFAQLAPALDQTFFVGDGLRGPAQGAPSSSWCPPGPRGCSWGSPIRSTGARSPGNRASSTTMAAN